MSSNIKRFILFGDSGAGKSSFVNSYYNYCYGTRNCDEVFNDDQKNVRLAIPCRNWLDRLESDVQSTERDINDQSKSQTMDCTLYQLRFEDLTIELIDTPGFNDTQGISKDNATLRRIEQILENIPFLTGLIIVANGSIARVGSPFRHFIRSLHQVWPKSLMQNVCTVLTNCDSMSCNFSSDILENEIKANPNVTFHLQNSLFRWDRTMQDKKTMRNLKRDFEETIETFEKLYQILKKFEDIPTNTFKMSGLMQSYIEEGIVNSIDRMIDLIKNNHRQNIIADSLMGAQATMAANTNWGKQASITAFKWMEVETPEPYHRSPTTFTEPSNSCDKLFPKHHEDYQHEYRQSTSSYRIRSKNNDRMTNEQDIRPAQQHQPIISDRNLKPYGRNDNQLEAIRTSPRYQRQDLQLNVTLLDNEAKSRYQRAQRDEQRLRSKEAELSEEEHNLIREMNLLLDQLRSDVQDLCDINPDIDLLESNQRSLHVLWDEIERNGAESKFVQFFDQVVQILTKPKPTEAQYE